MRKGIFTAVTAIMLLVGSATAFADGPSYPPGTNTNTNMGNSGSSSGQPITTAPSPSQTYQARVNIQNHAFTPANLTVWQGTSVIWTNEDNTAHTVTSDNSANGQGFDSGPIQPGQHFGWLFGGTGTFAYHCSIHPDMTGTITVVVKPATAPPSTSSPSRPSNSSTPSASAQSNATATVNNYNTFNQEAEQEPATTPTTTAPPPAANPAPVVSYPKEVPATTVLPDTGPTSVIVLTAAATTVGACTYYIYLFARKRLPAS